MPCGNVSTAGETRALPLLGVFALHTAVVVSAEQLLFRKAYLAAPDLSGPPPPSSGDLLAGIFDNTLSDHYRVLLSLIAR